MGIILLLALFLCYYCLGLGSSTVHAWTSSSSLRSIRRYQQHFCGSYHRHHESATILASSLEGTSSPQNDQENADKGFSATVDILSSSVTSRRRLLTTTVISSSASIVALLLPSALPANALVKGVAPPPPKSKASGSGDKPRCTNVEECQALAEQREAELRAKEDSGPPPMMTKGGVKYRDLTVGQGEQEVSSGDEVRLYFKVLKLGKRSYDGLSGEGTVVFSRGYGFEDDEDKPGTKFFQTVVGNTANIAALNEALVGMKTDGIRRFAILPQKGWERAVAACDGGPGGSGAGGEVKTDYVVVPTAQLVEQESCFDKTKLPFPSTYAQQRRMAQRFDQSLIMEVQLVSINRNNLSSM